MTALDAVLCCVVLTPVAAAAVLGGLRELASIARYRAALWAPTGPDMRPEPVKVLARAPHMRVVGPPARRSVPLPRSLVELEMELGHPKFRSSDGRPVVVDVEPLDLDEL